MVYRVAPNAEFFGALLAQISAPNKPEALRGNHSAQMRAKARAIWRTNGAVPLVLGTSGKLSETV